ncbi:MAG: hypothetical protein ACE5D4_05780 [Thermodesulfobacteriota bacterium]
MGNSSAAGGSERREVYLLTIYRRDQTGRERLVGTVEAVGSKRKEAFRTKEELLHIIEGLQGAE